MTEADWPDTTPRRRLFGSTGLVLFVACLCALAVAQAQGPSFEAQTVVQARSGADTLPLIEARLMGRDALLATAVRQGISGDDAAVTLRTAVALHNLTSPAGSTLGLAPEVSGVVISVRLPQADLAVRVANDLALQVLDLGQAGDLDSNHDALDFYRNEEQRLWQEVSALRAELGAVLQTSVGIADGMPGKDRKLMLLKDLYEEVRHRLAEEEIASRFADRQRADQFALLQRATTAQVVQTGNFWMLLVLLAATFLALVVAFGAGQQLAKPNAMLLKSRVRGGYLPFDDPDRPLFGLPRLLVLTVALVGVLIGLSVVLR